GRRGARSQRAKSCQVRKFKAKPAPREDLRENAETRLLHLDSEPAPEASSGIVRFGAVVIREDCVVAAITEEGASEFSDRRRCFDPARRLAIEGSEPLQFSILFFG